MTDSSLIETKEDLGKTPRGIARRWKLELKLADKREFDWRKKVSDIYKIYTPLNAADNSFNILHPNTETLRESVYNSLPQPDARRRYQDEDPLGKAVGQVMTRALEFAQDTYDFDSVLKGDVLTMLLSGRAVSRVRYIPDIRTVGDKEPEEEVDDGDDPYEEIAWEQVIGERVQWKDFRILCAAATWDEVTAIAFRHQFNRDDLIDKFGEEIGKKIALDHADDEDVKKSSDLGDLFKTAEIWEIWDKDEKEVLFICKTYPEPCKVQPDPLQLSGFFPIPRPLYAIENDQTLIPAPLYCQYEQQAKELNTVSTRINKLTASLRLRGIYDSTLAEIARLQDCQDNELIPSVNAAALIDRGGLEKAIWMYPIEQAAIILKELNVQRDATIQVIYQINGISDIMRSASDPQETYGAQKIKTQWGTQRLQRMQKEVQRYIRDLIRLKAEIIAEKFQPETLEKMTLVKLPHQAEVDQQKAVLMQQWQQQAIQAQQQGQPPPPMPQKPPNLITWEDVIGAMRADATRTYRIDIETDSTLSASQDSDMAGMRELLTGLVGLVQGFGPAVQEGAMDVSVLKELMLAVTRRAKMGSAVEDAIEKMQQPKPKEDPNAAKAQADAQALQAKNQSDMQFQQAKMQMDGQAKQQELAAEYKFKEMEAQLSVQVEQHKQSVQQQQIEAQNQIQAERETMQSHNDAMLEQIRIESEAKTQELQNQVNLLIAQMNNATKVEVAEIAAATAISGQQAAAAKEATNADV